MKNLLARVMNRSRARAARSIEKGLDHESRGELVDAEREYRAAYGIDRENQDAAYLLGSVCGRLGKLDEAQRLLGSILAINPRFAPACRDLALALHASGRRADAAEQYRRAFDLDPSDPLPALNLAMIQREDGHAELSESTLRELLNANPDLKEAVARLAALLVDTGRAGEAVALLEVAIHRRPDADLAYQLGVARQSAKDASGAALAFESAVGLRSAHRPSLLALGRMALRDAKPDEARRWLQRAFDADPSCGDVQSDLGESFLRLRLWGDARHWLTLAIERNPGDVKARQNLALVEYNERRYDIAERLYRQLAEDCPRDPGAHAGLGRSLQQLGRFDEAISCYRRALEISPQSHEALNNLGTALQEQGDFEAAAAHFERTVESFPDFLDARSNLGLVYLDLGRTSDAIACFDDVLRRDANLDEARFNRAVARLRSGDYERGWDDYDARWGSRFAVERPYRYPEWDGRPLAGRRLLVYGEQGLGDEIMFASCVPELISRGASVVLECSPKLETLFARSFVGATVVPGLQGHPPESTEDFPVADVQIACGSLPRLFRRELGAFPEHRGYLRADATRVAYWRARLDALGPGPKVGLSWRGGAVRTRRRLRSMDLEALMQAIHRPGALFVSLQYTDCREEVSALERNRGIMVHHWQEAIDDYDETAALVSALDVVVTVCTSIVHLSGALGKNALVMVPCSAEWRYGDRGERMPWYPGVRLIRQKQPGEWGPVLQDVSREIDTLAQGGERNVLAQSSE